MNRCDATFRHGEFGPIVLTCTLLVQNHDEDGNRDAGLLDVELQTMLEVGLFCELSRNGAVNWKGTIGYIDRDEATMWLKEES